LPDDTRYDMLSYPTDVSPYDPEKHKVLAYRYSRLLHPGQDTVIGRMLSDAEDFDAESSAQESKVEELLEKLRKKPSTAEQIIKAVFRPEFNVDDSGGYYTHNLVMCCGQQFDETSKTYKSFFEEAVDSAFAAATP
jgi:hypothetical protein